MPCPAGFGRFGVVMEGLFRAIREMDDRIRKRDDSGPERKEYRIDAHRQCPDLSERARPCPGLPVSSEIIRHRERNQNQKP